MFISDSGPFISDLHCSSDSSDYKTHKKDASQSIFAMHLFLLAVRPMRLIMLATQTS
ncbi:hypothetical protein ACIQYL_19395 [Lysinibacillus xylanilyticus]|uniref:hypothetical protein n=1 Tax=Lysinibacillus xylanilyticus TaxID=582475 RepID=UPI00380714EE